MIEFGKTLREAREARGLTVADIANKTHMMSAMVSDLENEDFTRLPAPIYGRGFIKLYCETVGLDPAPLIAEFMEICNGNREPAIRERPVAPNAAAEPPSESVTPKETLSHAEVRSEATAEPAVEAAPAPDRPEPVFDREPPRHGQLDLFAVSTVPVPPKTYASIPPPTPEEPAAETPKREHLFAHYASPLRDPVFKFPRLAPAIGRWCVVIGILALLGWAAAVGMKALYRATTNTPTETSQPTAKTSPVPTVKPANQVPATSSNTPAAAKPVKTGRKPMAVPPLYID